MQQGPSLVLSPSAMGSDILRRRLIGNNQSSGVRLGAARCLFGPPNPTIAKEMAQKVQSKGAWSFGRKWNFDVSGNSQPVTCLQSSRNPEPKYQWDEVFDEDTMAKCDRHRFQVPSAPNTRPVTLFYAPTILPEPDAPITAESVAVQTDAPLPQTAQRSPSVESVSVQTELTSEGAAHQGQEASNAQCELTLRLISCPDSDGQSEMMVVEGEEVSPVERRYPAPLTIPTSPDLILEDEEVSPTDDLSMSNDEYGSSFGRRELDDIFNFHAIHHAPPGGFKCLRVRNVNPSVPSSVSKKMKQRCITEYMQVKKSKMSCAKKI